MILISEMNSLKEGVGSIKTKTKRFKVKHPKRKLFRYIHLFTYIHTNLIYHLPGGWVELEMAAWGKKRRKRTTKENLITYKRGEDLKMHLFGL